MLDKLLIAGIVGVQSGRAESSICSTRSLGSRLRVSATFRALDLFAARNRPYHEVLYRITAPCAYVPELITVGSPACPHGPLPDTGGAGTRGANARACRTVPCRPGNSPDSEHAAE